jgi:putative peptide zinc metalloprotease protein
VAPAGHEVELADAGSTYGTVVDGRRVEGAVRVGGGSRIRLGDVEVGVEAAEPALESGRTIVRPAAASVGLPAPGESDRPRVRSGWALKRVESEAGEFEYVLRNLRDGSFVRMQAADAELFLLVDGSRSITGLLEESRSRLGPTGPGRLAGLLADLGDRGLLAGVSVGARQAPSPWALTEALRPRELVLPTIGDAVMALHRRGGHVVATGAFAWVAAAIAVAGLAVFLVLIARRYGTPFVVADRLGVGAAVFVLGRLLVAGLHELAHGLVLASCGRAVHRAGVKVVLVFPYLFVDTSESWFEPRRRRLAITAAGPLSDGLLGALFSFLALGLGPGAHRDVFFQLALGAYVGALFNLNPLADRDGYHLLVDLLSAPGLRARAQRWLAARIAGRETGGTVDRLVRMYALAGLGWLLVAAAAGILFATLYYRRLVGLTSPEVAWVVIGLVYALLAAPVAIAVGRPLRDRLRARAGGAVGRR